MFTCDFWQYEGNPSSQSMESLSWSYYKNNLQTICPPVAVSSILPPTSCLQCRLCVSKKFNSFLLFHTNTMHLPTVWIVYSFCSCKHPLCCCRFLSVIFSGHSFALSQLSVDQGWATGSLQDTFSQWKNKQVLFNFKQQNKKTSKQLLEFFSNKNIYVQCPCDMELFAMTKFAFRWCLL